MQWRRKGVPPPSTLIVYDIFVTTVADPDPFFYSSNMNNCFSKGSDTVRSKSLFSTILKFRYTIIKRENSYFFSDPDPGFVSHESDPGQVNLSRYPQF